MSSTRRTRRSSVFFRLTSAVFSSRSTATLIDPGVSHTLGPIVLTGNGPGQVALPGWFLRFIGVAEVLGALGLVLPGLLRIRPGLIPLAAAGLVIIMIGATIVMWAGGMVAVALMNLVVTLLAAFVAYGRWRLAPYRDSSRPAVLRPARVQDSSP